MPEALDTATLILGATWYVVFLLSLTFHEAGHAWAALKLGDPTAYEGGQVTLNPLPHVRRAPVGTIVVPIISFALSGWMIGWASAPYDPVWAERHPKKEALMAAAGPAANLLLMALAMISIRVGYSAGWLAAPESIAFDAVTVALAPWADGFAPLLSILFSLNLLLFVFNLLPFPPLDGSAIFPILFGERAARGYKALLRSQPMLSLAGLLIAWNLFNPIFQPVYRVFLSLLYPGISYG